MLTNDQVAALQTSFEKIADPVTEHLIQDVARRVSQAGQLTSTAAYQIWRAQNLGKSRNEIEKAVAAILKKSTAEVQELFKQAAEVGYRFDLDQLPTAEAIPFEDNASVQQLVEAAVKLADENFQNITQTLGFQTPDGTVHPMLDAYQKTTDFAFQQVFTGATDYNTAIRQACKKLADGGVKSIDYASGVHTSLEAAIRRNMMGGLGLMVEQISEKNHDDLGADGWELSAHANSAPDHEPFQGKQYTDKEYEALNGSLQRRIGTLNCGHNAFPIILGVNEPQYTKEQLEKFRKDNEKGITFEGRHYTGYEATQMQRKLERSIRAQKRRVLAAEATGDKEDLTIAQTRLQMLRQNYSRFSKAAGLRTEDERLRVSGLGRKQGRNFKQNGKIAKTEVENLNSRGIINSERGMSMGLRHPASHILTSDEIAAVFEDARALGIDASVLSINTGERTGFLDMEEKIHVRGDILPDMNSKIARDRMSQRAVLAHEYYGHYKHHPSEYDIGDWRDEFRASYEAAIKAPNLTDEDRAYLMIDAYDRAREAGELLDYDETARRIIYGY